MSIGYLNERTAKMIHMLVKGSSVMTIKEVAAGMEVSTRTIYNELEKANDWLGTKELPKIEVIRGKIQVFSEQEKHQIEEAMEIKELANDYIFTPTERMQMIICQIVLAKEPIYIEDLMNSCQVSRNTIFTDLQSVIIQLSGYHLELKYEKKAGYWIEGDPIRVRAIFFLYFNMLEPLFSSGKLSFLQTEEINPYMEQIGKVEKRLKVHYVRNDKIALAAMIAVMKRGNAQLCFSDVDAKRVEESEEYKLVSEYFGELGAQERVYLTLHFLGGRLESYSKTEQNGKPNEFILEISKNLVKEFEKNACVSFRKKDKLIENLYQHIKSSIYRYWYGIQIGNLMVEDIKREYPYIFDVMRVTVRYLEHQIGVQISDSEVSYLALHFGAHLEFAKHDEKELRILVVCMNGVATGNMISHELMRILPQAKIVGVTAASDLMNPQDVCDIIVSSVKMQTVVPVIVVNPILNDFDRKNILNHPMIKSRFGFVDIGALYKVVKKYVPKDQHKALKNDLEKFFLHKEEKEQPILNPEIWRLTDFLTEDRIIFLDSSGRKESDHHSQEIMEDHYETNWERALAVTAAPLIHRHSIDSCYVDGIIARLKEAGPYMFVSKDLILAHSRPEDGVKRLDLSIGLCKEGIEFEHGKKARIIFCLAVKDQHKHMGILRDIRKSMAKKAQVDELIKLGEATKVCEHLRMTFEENG